MPGPFDVDPSSVGRLGAAFAPFINDLLEAERARARIAGYALDINWQPNTKDGGVDAALRGAVQTTWFPAGDSVWQFKGGDLEPAECKEELRGAKWARDEIDRGATYVLVLGRPLLDDVKSRRREALVEEATALDLSGGAFLVYDGNQLARWISTLPSLALDARLGGPGPVLLDFPRWSQSRDHQERWVPCESRGAIREGLRQLTSGELQACRVEGGAGLGKTRLVMEALGEDESRLLVACAPRADQVGTDILSYLQGSDRTCIFVVDECTQALHKSISEQLAADSGVRLVTVGPPGGDPVVRDPVHQIAPATDDELEEVLRENVSGLWPEARRVVKTSCFGNVRTALLLGRRLVDSGETAVAALLREGDIRDLVLKLLPDHIDFFSAAVLALTERVGWDRDRRHQLEALSEFARVSVEDLERTARQLDDAGLLSQLGRYRAVGPEPVAVFLAAHCWEVEGQRILSELVPMVDREMLESLFRRCAELGRFEPAQSVLNGLIGSEGPLGSLERIEDGDLGELLVQLAIILPESLMDHLGELIEVASIDALSTQVRSRRSLVRALEKLVWHPQTFVRAAACLLRLAQAENESWANNATGQWKSLFGARLPTTAADPDTRIKYLASCSQSPDDFVRRLAVQAASDALDPYESVMVSGELQGGAVVAPRGSVRPGNEALSYWSSLVAILDDASMDEDEQVRAVGRDGLVAAIHPFLEVPEVGERLTTALLRQDEALRRKIRTTVDHLSDLADRPSDLAEALDRLRAALPEASPIERIRELAEISPWDWSDDDERKSELVELLREVGAADNLVEVLRWLKDDEMANAWHLGAAIASVENDSSTEDVLVAAVGRNAAALAGYLDQQVKGGDVAAFDRLIDSPTGAVLDPTVRLYLTTAGPSSDAARRRAITVLDELGVIEGTSGALRWLNELAVGEIGILLTKWTDQVSDDREYSAVVRFISVLAHRLGALPEELQDGVFALLTERARYPNLGTERFGWCRLAVAAAQAHPEEMVRLIFDLVSEGQHLLHESDHEAVVVGAAATSAPDVTWGFALERIAGGDWRLSMALRGWFPRYVPVEVVRSWVGDSLDRARLAASIAPATSVVKATEEDEEDQVVPSDLAIYLLESFGDDDEVAGALAGDFQSGGWVGPWSGRIAKQIADLTGWRRDMQLPIGVRTWAGRMIEGLERQRADALEREAEEHW